MDALSVLKTVANETNTPITHIGIAMGHKRTYANTVISKGAIPRCDTMARMLNVCGYGLYAMPMDTAPQDAIQITND